MNQTQKTGDAQPAAALRSPSDGKSDPPRPSVRQLAAKRRRGSSNGLPRRRAILSAALAVLLSSAGLTGCEPARSFERASDGSTIYIDQLSEAAKAEARQKIVDGLKRGIGVYDLGVGDAVEVFFHIDWKPTLRGYTINPGDKLYVEIVGDKTDSQTVIVRPDGRISVALLGPIMAAGQTADALARQLEERYSHVLSTPNITVGLIQSHSVLDDFITAIGSTTNGRSLIATVLPDGTMSMPLVGPIQASGRPLKAVEQAVDAAYAAKGLDVFVSLVPRTLRPGIALVIGEVSKPGPYGLDQPATVLMAVADAGGVLPTGAMDAVRVFYTGKDGAPRVRSINLNEVIDDLKLEDDMLVPENSVIYVPPTGLAKTGRWLDAVLRDILRYQGLNIGGAVLINQ